MPHEKREITFVELPPTEVVDMAVTQYQTFKTPAAGFAALQAASGAKVTYVTTKTPPPSPASPGQQSDAGLKRALQENNEQRKQITELQTSLTTAHANLVSLGNATKDASAAIDAQAQQVAGINERVSRQLEDLGKSVSDASAAATQAGEKAGEALGKAGGDFLGSLGAGFGGFGIGAILVLGLVLVAGRR